MQGLLVKLCQLDNRKDGLIEVKERLRILDLDKLK